jgi:hypothetical protein
MLKVNKKKNLHYILPNNQHVHIKINGNALQIDDTTAYLGITLDCHIT